MSLGPTRWGKTQVRVSKVLRGDVQDDFLEITVDIMLEGDVEEAHIRGDNSNVLPTDTMRNTVYGMAQDHLNEDLEAFAETLCRHFLSRPAVHRATVEIAQARWVRRGPKGFIGGGSERRLARLSRGQDESTVAGIEGLVVLKTGGSSFEGFPRDEFTILPEAADRILATSVTADWTYTEMPSDTSLTWETVRSVLVERFFDDWSASVQHQGYLMGEAVLATVGEIGEIRLRLPNQHHLPFDLTRFGMPWDGTVLHPVGEPYGDIFLTVTR